MRKIKILFNLFFVFGFIALSTINLNAQNFNASEENVPDIPASPDKKQNIQPKNTSKLDTVILLESGVYLSVEQMPEFPGGTEALYKFIGNNLRYPALARERNIQGIVLAQFIIHEDGYISDIEIVEDIGGGCDQEILRVIGLMPKWNPGRHKGKPVKVLYKLPVRFKLE